MCFSDHPLICADFSLNNSKVTINTGVLENNMYDNFMTSFNRLHSFQINNIFQKK